MVVISAGLARLLKIRMNSEMVMRNSIDLTFITPKGESKTVKARIGDSVLETAQVNNLPICGKNFEGAT